MTLAEELQELDDFYGLGRTYMPKSDADRVIARYGRLPLGVFVEVEPHRRPRLPVAPAARPFSGAHWKQRR